VRAPTGKDPVASEFQNNSVMNVVKKMFVKS